MAWHLLAMCAARGHSLVVIGRYKQMQNTDTKNFGREMLILMVRI